MFEHLEITKLIIHYNKYFQIYVLSSLMNVSNFPLSYHNFRSYNNVTHVTLLI